MTPRPLFRGLQFWALPLLLVLAHPLLPIFAQESEPRDELLRLIPRDTAVCLVVQDLRGQAEKMGKAPWLQRLQNSQLGKSLAGFPEFQKLVRLEEDLKKYLQIDWPQLRDNILGDAVVFAYKPGAAGKDEEGLLLLNARQPDLLARIIERINQEQSKSKELQELVGVDYQGIKYYRRVEKGKSHYYLLKGRLFVFASTEGTIKEVVDQFARAGELPTLVQHFRKSGSEKSLFSLWLNPRAFEGELQQKIQKGDATEALVLQSFLGYWRALDGILLSLTIQEDVEVRLSLHARPGELPAAAKRLFADVQKSSDLWNRFPADAIVTLAGRLDVPALSEALAEFTPAPVRKLIADGLQKNLADALGLDLNQDLLPNLGPDWGFTILAPAERTEVPQVLAALGVKPGNKDVAVDQTLVKGIQFFAGLMVIEYNRTHADRMRLNTVLQDNVEVKYLSNDKIFPAGFQPAFALKDGYLVLSSSPAAIRRFGKGSVLPLPAGEIPLLRIAPPELAKVLQNRRDKVTEFLAEKNAVSKETAGQWLDGLLAALELFDQVQLNHRTDPGQVTWIVRFRPGRPAPSK